MNHGLTLEEIGSKFNLTRERVRQIKEKAIILNNVGEENLKQVLSSPILKNYESSTLLNTAYLIREAAKRTGDKQVIHPDAWPKNFVYNKTERKKQI